ncbi:MAG: TetR/AcrR family transcriptional regulator [Rhizobiaceae bacterium]
MSGKRAEKREDLRTRLIEAAEARVIAGGLAALRARDITTDAGCALGALYNAFADLDMLVLEVNARTLRRLDEAMTASLSSTADHGRQLHLLAQTYLDFARREPNLWWALFQFHFPAEKTIPDWFSQEQAKLLIQIIRPLTGLQPKLDAQQLMIRARTLFAAVHGIVSISLEKRFVGVPIETLDGELTRFIDLLLAGLPVLDEH